MKKPDHYTFFLLKPSVINGVSNNKEIRIKKFITEHGFKIIREKRLRLSDADLLRLYGSDIRNTAKTTGKNDATTMFKSYQHTLKKGDCILLLVYHPRRNAKNYGTELKGTKFLGVENSHDKMRYIFRDKNYDSFRLPPGRIMMIPCDNTVHCARNDSEFGPFIKRYFPKEYYEICK